MQLFHDRPQLYGRNSSLPSLFLSSGPSITVIDSVTYQMEDRFADFINDGFVEFGLFSLKNQIDFLAVTAGKSRTSPLNRRKNHPYRKHPYFHDGSRRSFAVLPSNWPDS